MRDEIDDFDMIKGFVREYKKLYPFVPNIDESKIKPDLEYYGFWGRTDKAICDFFRERCPEASIKIKKKKPFVCHSLL